MTAQLTFRMADSEDAGILTVIHDRTARRMQDRDKWMAYVDDLPQPVGVPGPRGG